jgi:hypothetical protein
MIRPDRLPADGAERDQFADPLASRCGLCGQRRWLSALRAVAVAPDVVLLRCRAGHEDFCAGARPAPLWIED